MNRKVVLKNLNITNYPLIEEYLSEMAAKGWMIKRILDNSVFIFKRMESQDLDFSIVPYEAESFLSKKTKKDLNEFQEVVESTGWNFAVQSSDFHIYYKDSSEDLVELQTDKEEEFEAINAIGKRVLFGNYVLLAMFSFIIINSIRTLDILDILSSNVILLGIPMFFFALLSIVFQLVIYHRFLYKNGKNIEEGRDLEFSKSDIKSKLVGYLISLSAIFAILVIVVETYNIVRYGNLDDLYYFLPLLLGISIALVFRYFIKPMKTSGSNKFIVFMVIMGFVIIVTIVISTNTEEEFSDENLERDSSIFIPESYNYYKGWYTNSIEVNYYKALNEDIAGIIVDNKIKNREDEIEGIKEEFKYIKEDPEEEEYFDEYYIFSIINREEYQMLKEVDNDRLDEVAKEIIDDNISKDDEGIWNADELYYLSKDKTMALVRYDNEVYFFRGFDFSNEEKIEEVKKEYINQPN